MGTQLILTVGTNALPVWVAWYHLKDKLEQPVYVRFVHTRQTKPETMRLKQYFRGATFLSSLETSSGNPSTVRDDIMVVLNETTNLHVHYTGGTKVMSVETVSAIEAKRGENISLQTSYLDPRGDSGPIIVSRQPGPLVEDTRKGISPSLKLIADLNGFELGKNVGKNVRTPTSEQLHAGQQVLDSVIVDASMEENFRLIFSNRNSPWNEAFADRRGNFCRRLPENGNFHLPDKANDVWKDQLLPKLNEVYTNCKWNLGDGTLSYSPRNKQQMQEMEQMHNFLNGIWLEYAVYAALSNALKGIFSNNNERGNYALFHNVYVQRSRGKLFELDVLAVLGHQIVVVSCTFTSNQALIKQKGMEAILRARQLGGDEARAIVLCSADKSVSDLVQRELHDEIGSTAPPLEIWGKSRYPRRPMQELTNKFGSYLRDKIKWQ